MRNSFVFYRSFNEAMEELSENDQLVLYRAIVDYGLDSREPSFNSSYLRMAWKLIKPQLDANWKRYNNGCKGKEFGKRGGAPKGNKNATKTTPKQPQDNPKTTPNDNDNDNNKASTNVPKKDGLSLPPKTSLKHKQEQMVARKAEFQNLLGKHLDRNGGGYSADMLNEFFSYWTEPNKSQTKMRFEQQPTWDMSRRLARWEKNNYKYGKGGNS